MKSSITVGWELLAKELQKGKALIKILMGFPHCALCVALADLSFSLVSTRIVLFWKLLKTFLKFNIGGVYPSYTSEKIFFSLF